MRTTMLVLLICVLTQTTAFAELTKQDLDEIQEVVKEEISASEQRTGIKLADIKTEIRVIQTDIKGVKDRLGDTHRLVLVLIGLIGGTMVIAVAMTYAARKLAGAIDEIQKVHASNDETKELLKKNTEARNEYTEEVREANNRLRRQEELREEQNAHLADMQKAVDELRRLIAESTDEPTNDPIAHAPAD